jgi:hypothetical protein
MRTPTKTGIRLCLAAGAGVAALFWNGAPVLHGTDQFTTAAEAVIGRPATPLSYAGVARRTTVRRAVRPGVGYGGVGGPASGVGVLPGAGAGRPGVGPNLGGPVNRVGLR